MYELGIARCEYGYDPREPGRWRWYCSFFFRYEISLGTINAAQTVVEDEENEDFNAEYSQT